MKCPKCGSENVAVKTITSKKTGKPYDLYECQAGCKSDKGYAFSFFPDKQKNTSNEVVSLLTETNKLLAEISNKLGGKMSFTNSELKPDSMF